MKAVNRDQRVFPHAPPTLIARRLTVPVGGSKTKISTLEGSLWSLRASIRPSKGSTVNGSINPCPRGTGNSNVISTAMPAFIDGSTSSSVTTTGKDDTVSALDPSSLTCAGSAIPGLFARRTTDFLADRQLIDDLEADRERGLECVGGIKRRDRRALGHIGERFHLNRVYDAGERRPENGLAEVALGGFDLFPRLGDLRRRCLHGGAGLIGRGLCGYALLEQFFLSREILSSVSRARFGLPQRRLGAFQLQLQRHRVDPGDYVAGLDALTHIEIDRLEASGYLKRKSGHFRRLQDAWIASDRRMLGLLDQHGFQTANGWFGIFRRSARIRYSPRPDPAGQSPQTASSSPPSTPWSRFSNHINSVPRSIGRTFVTNCHRFSAFHGPRM